MSVFPVYYRAIALIVLGGWCWGFNVQGLDKCGFERKSVAPSILPCPSALPCTS